MLKGSGDGEAEGMLTRAPPDHQATCFNIHDITSSLGGPGLHGNEAARSGLLSLEEDRLCLSLSLCRSLSLSQQWLAGIGTFTMYAIIWTDLEYRFDLTTREDVTVPKVYYILFSQGYNSILYARSSRTIWLIHQWTLFIHQPSIFIKEFSAHIGLPLMHELTGHFLLQIKSTCKKFCLLTCQHLFEFLSMVMTSIYDLDFCEVNLSNMRFYLQTRWLFQNTQNLASFYIFLSWPLPSFSHP